jgi:hypothetical protein
VVTVVEDGAAHTALEPGTEGTVVLAPRATFADLAAGTRHRLAAGENHWLPWGQGVSDDASERLKEAAVEQSEPGIAQSFLDAWAVVNKPAVPSSGVVIVGYDPDARQCVPQPLASEVTEGFVMLMQEPLLETAAADPQEVRVAASRGLRGISRGSTFAVPDSC